MIDRAAIADLPFCGSKEGIYWVEDMDGRFIEDFNASLRAFDPRQRRIVTLKPVDDDFAFGCVTGTVPWAQRTQCGQCKQWIKDCTCSRSRNGTPEPEFC